MLLFIDVVSKFRRNSHGNSEYLKKMLRTQLYTVEGRTSYFQINRLIKNQVRECTLLNRSTVYEVLRVLESASTSHVIIACWFQKLDCFKEKCLRYCLKIVHLKLFFHIHCVSLESRLSLLCICSSDWSDLGYCPLIGRCSDHRLGQLGPLRPLKALLARPGPRSRPRSPHGLYVLQELGQPVLSALIVLTQDTE